MRTGIETLGVPLRGAQRKRRVPEGGSEESKILEARGWAEQKQRRGESILLVTDYRKSEERDTDQKARRWCAAKKKRKTDINQVPPRTKAASSKTKRTRYSLS